MLRLYLTDNSVSNDYKKDIFYFIVHEKENLNKILYISEEKKVNDSNLIVEFDSYYIEEDENEGTDLKVDIDHILTRRNTELKLYKKNTEEEEKEEEDDILIDTFIINTDVFHKDMISYLFDNRNSYFHNKIVLFSEQIENSIQIFDRITKKNSNQDSKRLISHNSYETVGSYTFTQLIKLDKLTNYYLRSIIKETEELKQKIHYKLQFKKNVNNLKLNYYNNSNKYILKKIDMERGNILDLQDEIGKIEILKKKFNKKLKKLESGKDNLLESPINNPLHQTVLAQKQQFKQNLKMINDLLLNILQIDLDFIDVENIKIGSFLEIQRFNYKLGNLLLYLQIIHKILKLPFYFNHHKMMVRYKSSQSFIVILTKDETVIGSNKLIIPLYILSYKSLDQTSDYYKQFKIGIDWLNSKIIIIRKYLDYSA